MLVVVIAYSIFIYMYSETWELGTPKGLKVSCILRWCYFSGPFPHTEYGF